MNDYRDFSVFYDRLMREVDYPARADYLLSVFKRHSCLPHDLLDLACGSGSLTMELARHGMDMIGVDGSADMLALALEKNREEQLPILYLEQDMRELDLYGTVCGAVCTLDSMNHLVKTADIERVLQRLSLFIEPGGLFLFDVNTPYKHRCILADNAFVFEEEDFMCVWRNRLISKTCEEDMLLDFFVGQDENYRRFTDTVRERAYSLRTWQTLLEKAGFEMEALYADMTFEEPDDTCERWLIVAKNCKK